MAASSSITEAPAQRQAHGTRVANEATFQSYRSTCLEGLPEVGGKSRCGTP